MKLEDKIVNIDIDKIKPDPTQPRTTIDEMDLREMAQSILTEGIINPIEIDSKYMIVTGERRWRASKIAGLKTIRAIIIDVTKDERFMRQVIENLHHNTMTDWDTANALKKLADLYLSEIKTNKEDKGRPDIGKKWLAEKTGKSLGYIEDKFNLLDQSSTWQKAIKKGEMSNKFTAALVQVPKDFKKVVEKKFLAGEFATRDGAREFVGALKREQDNPNVVKKLLETDYSKHKGFHEVEKVVSQISPRAHEIVAKTYEPSQEISKIVNELKEWVRKNPKSSVGKIHAPRVIVNMNFARALIEEWFEGEENTKLLN